MGEQFLCITCLIASLTVTSINHTSTLATDAIAKTDAEMKTHLVQNPTHLAVHVVHKYLNT